MSRILFTFTYDTDTQESIFSGNVSTDIAAVILQKIAIANAIQETTKQLQDKKEQSGG